MVSAGTAEEPIEFGDAPHPSSSSTATTLGNEAAFFLGFPDSACGLEAAVRGGFGGGEVSASRLQLFVVGHRVSFLRQSF